MATKPTMLVSSDVFGRMAKIISCGHIAEGKSIPGTIHHLNKEYVITGAMGTGTGAGWAKLYGNQVVNLVNRGGWISSSTPDSSGLVLIDRSTGSEVHEPEVSLESFKRKLGTYRGLARLNLMDDIKTDLLQIVPVYWEPDYMKESNHRAI